MSWCSRLLVALVLLGPGCSWPTPSAGEKCTEIGVPPASITTDGETSDWSGIEPKLKRDAAKPNASTGGYNLTAFYVAADTAKLYLRIDAVVSSAKPADGGSLADAGTAPCNRNNYCEPGESSDTCPEDCGGSSNPPQFQVFLKTSGPRSGNVWVNQFRTPPDCEGNWQSNDGPGSKIACGLGMKQTGGGVVIEIWIPRSELGELINLYPTRSHHQENSDHGPTIDDEIGCVWSRWKVGASTDGSIPDGQCTPDCTGRACGLEPRCGVECGTCPAGVTCSAAGSCEASVPTWQVVPIPASLAGKSLTSIWGSSSSDAWAVGESGTILHYDGSQWSDSSSGLPYSLRHVHGLPGSTDPWAVGEAGSIFRYSGQWNTETSFSGEVLNGVWPAPSGEVWTVGGNGTLLRRNPGGTWGDASHPAGTSSTLHAIWGQGSSIFVAGAQVLLRGDGTSWSSLPAGQKHDLRALSGKTENDVWAVGSNGVALHYDGKDWSPVPTGTLQVLTSVWASPDGVWAVGESGTILHRIGYDHSFVIEPSGTKAELRGVWASPTGELWAVGAGGLILRRP